MAPASGDDSKLGIIEVTGVNVNVICTKDSIQIGTITKTYLDGLWNVFFVNVIQFHGTKQGSFNQLNTMEARLACSLINNHNVTFADTISDKLVTRVATTIRAMFVPYTRVLSLVIQSQFDKYDMLPLQSIKPSIVGKKIYNKDHH